MNDFLLDTHTLLWWQTGNPKLPAALLRKILQPEQHVWISIASWWEIGIKVSLGRLPEAVPIEALMGDADAAGFQTLAIKPAHILNLSRLPFPDNGHRDPFDRLLVAQAQAENLILVSCDAKFAGYSVRHEF